MTQPEFFAYTQLYPTQVNIWYSDGAAPYTIRALSVPVLDNSTPPEDVTAYLNQVQQISIPLSTGIDITLNILTRQSVVTPLGKYYYFTIEPYEIANIGDTVISNDDLVFSPAIDSNEFNNSAYNTLQGLVESSRTSTYIMQSDRYKIGTVINPTYTGPLNIDELLTGSATLADVQDSNYSVSGWTNARYQGSKTNRLTYKASEPATTGTVFEGSEFPSGSTITQIQYQMSSSQVIYSDYFYTGTGDTPGFQVASTGLSFDTTYDAFTGNIYIEPTSIGSIPPPPKIGDLLQVQNSGEIIKIKTVGVIPAPSLKYSLTVTRAYYGTASSISQLPVNKVTPTQIYNISGNRLTGVPRGKVVIKETGAIVTLDPLGFVIATT